MSSVLWEQPPQFKRVSVRQNTDTEASMTGRQILGRLFRRQFGALKVTVNRTRRNSLRRFACGGAIEKIGNNVVLQTANWSRALDYWGNIGASPAEMVGFTTQQVC